MIHYSSPEEDSHRWLGFEFRDGDIVISTRSKHGTTWMQTICALLVFRTPTFPRPLGELSPWLDWLGTPLAEVTAGLAGQDHRRIIKTHTPLDGIPLYEQASFIVVARHPLDAAVSLYHQSLNIDRYRLAELTGLAPPTEPFEPPPLEQWLASWVASDADPIDQLDSLNGVVHHVADAWSRRDEPNVLLVHYEDLTADLSGEMRRVADFLGVDLDAALLDRLSEAATFEAMRENSDSLAPDAGGVLVDPARFFRSGRSGDGALALDAADLAIYDARVAASLPADLRRWLHR